MLIHAGTEKIKNTLLEYNHLAVSTVKQQEITLTAFITEK